MRLTKYLTELFNQNIELKVTKDSWKQFSTHMDIANDIYHMDAQIIANEYDDDIKKLFTDKELKKLTGYTSKDVEKKSKEILAKREKRKTSGGIMMPMFNHPAREMSEYFHDNPVWVFGFGSLKYGDNILDIRTRKEVSAIFSGVKKSVSMFLKQKKPAFIIIDAKSSEKKRLPIYHRFVKEILSSAPYELMGGKRKFDYDGVKTEGWLLKRKGV